MRFAESVQKLLYLGKNEILAFDRNFVFKIDLNDAQPVNDTKKKLKDEWTALITQRLQRNNFVKKSLQLEEQRNDQFFQFQYHKQQHAKLNPSKKEETAAPELFRFNMQLVGFHSIHNSILQLEFDYLLSPETTKFDVNKFILLQPLAALMPHYEKAKEIKKQSKKRFSRGLN